MLPSPFIRKAGYARRLAALEWIDARLSLLRHARDKNSFVYPLAGHDGLIRWYLIHCGQVRAVCFAPTTDEEHQNACAIVDTTLISRAGGMRLNAGAIDSILLVLAWFRRNGSEREKLMSRVAATRRESTAQRV